MALPIPRYEIRELRHKLRPFGSRTHQGHFADQDIDQLWELVDRESANQPTEACSTRIVRRRPDRSRLDFCIRPHRAELEHVERPAIQTNPLLHVQNRPVW